MSDTDVFLNHGGELSFLMGADPQDPASQTWNFGIGKPLVPVETRPAFYEVFPNLQGRWDGKTSINHHDAVRKVLGTDLKAWNQARGLCGGHAGARGLELLQCIMIASGNRAKYKPVSHAWLYYLARKKYGMLGGGDGVAGGSIPEIMSEGGILNADEAGDTEFDGPNVDAVGVRWGAGQLRGEEANRLAGLARDNIVTAKLRCRSAQELADGIASMGVGICSDARGFTLTRDREGFCQPQGTWYHYHVRSGVFVSPSGRKGFAYDQSWGPGQPSGDLLPGYPSNCFGVSWDVMDASCRNGEVDVVLAVNLWDLEQGDLGAWFF